MLLLARNARAVTRAAPKTRLYSIVVDVPPAEWVAKRKAVKAHAGGVSTPEAFLYNLTALSVETAQLWRRIRYSFLLCSYAFPV